MIASKRSLSFMAMAAMALSSLAATATATEDNNSSGNLRKATAARVTHKKRLLVHCKPGTEEHCRKELEDAPAGRIVTEIKGTDFFAIEIDDDDEEHEEEGIIGSLSDVLDFEEDPPRFLFVMPDDYVPHENPPSRMVDYNGDRNLADGTEIGTSATEEIPYGIDMVGAPQVWSEFGKYGEGVKICVIDTGLRTSHEDIKDLNLEGQDLVHFGQTLSWDGDGDGHGTHVTGTCAAVGGNGKGVIGVAPKADIIVSRVFDGSGSFFGSGIAEALRDCLEQNADVVTMSLGGGSPSNAERNLIDQLIESGAVVVAATGNSGQPYSNPPQTGPLEYPAGYSNVLGIGASDSFRQLAPFSTFGDQVDLVGPGVSVKSTYKNNNQSYKRLSGTSMSTPHIAGVAALLKSIDPTLTSEEIKNLMINTANNRDGNNEIMDPFMYGNGHVDALAAARAISTRGVTEPPEPTAAPTECTNCINGQVKIVTDNYGSETTWKIVAAGEPTVGSTPIELGGPYASGQSEVINEDITLPRNTCFDFILMDSYNDGICCGHGQGSAEVSFNGQSVDVGQFTGAEVRVSFGSCNGDVDEEDAVQTSNPTVSPTQAPTDPTKIPTVSPTKTPSVSPTMSPSDPEVEDDLVDEDADLDGGNVIVSIFTDNYAEENSWEILDFYGNVVQQDGPFTDKQAMHIKKATVASSGCYRLVLKDIYGDGICCGYGSGSLTVEMDGDEVIKFEENENFEVKEFYFGNSPSCPNNDAPGSGLETGYVKIKTDQYGDETTWQLLDESEEILFSGGPYASPEGSEFESSFELNMDGCYTFRIFDRFGDGNCCGYGQGLYTVNFDNQFIVKDETFSGSFAEHTFGNC